MSVIRKNGHACAGASLLEVLIALSLLAASVLGMAASQLMSLRESDARTSHAHASWTASSVAEAMRWPELASPVLARRRAYVVAALPGGRISVVDDAGGSGAVLVQWASGSGSGSGSGPSEQRQPADAGLCMRVDSRASARCIAMPFASGE
ncbi:type IV pilus modification PilV family protein [Trinickia dinghuensis]|uniref:Prepilin-type N-terminal cleavage/methylation domain-containing protein n=1 Tax=Trinickia dinghuensis TaxID=2291023 RepID=A0A3D8JS61_9BURK|nr:hypothetical protein [Trinickia dinghuensis]RDU95959.1 hypothetical protein DWV00_25190 [Trinickia dinghuensis]